MLRGLACDAAYVAASLAFLAAAGGAAGHSIFLAGLFLAGYVAATGVYRYYRPAGCRAWRRGREGALAVSISLAILLVSAALYMAVRGAGGTAFWAGYITVKLGAAAVEVYAMNYLPAWSAAAELGLGRAWVAAFTLVQLAARGGVTLAVGALLPEGVWREEWPSSPAGVAGNVAAAYALAAAMELARPPTGPRSPRGRSPPPPPRSRPGLSSPS